MAQPEGAVPLDACGSNATWRTAWVNSPAFENHWRRRRCGRSLLDMNPAVHKFGGVALANAEAIRHAVGIVAKGRQHGVVVVASAMGGVTDGLLDVAALAKRHDRAGLEKAIASL